MAYIQLDKKSCVSEVIKVAGTLLGTVTITKCPTSEPNKTVVVGAVAKNVGTANNNSFVIGLAVARTDTGVLIVNGNSGNITLLAGQTSAEFTLSFTMPNSNVNVVADLQADPAFSY